MIAQAPAKVILSGEHAVVYGAPALAAAVQHYATAEAQPQHGRPELRLQLPDLELDRTIPYDQLPTLRQRCEARHRAYRDGMLPINQVVDAAELLFCALDRLSQRVPQILPATGLHLTLHSEIPVGAGMGSSAAVCAAALRACVGMSESKLTDDQLCQLVTAAEQLQHGVSSGLDPAMVVRGGLGSFAAGRYQPVDGLLHEQQLGQLPGHWWLVNSGRPSVSTGECVDQVRGQWSASGIWSEFSQVTASLQQALLQARTQQVADLLRHNHRLLCRIGVVPAAVQQFVRGIEAAGGAAKISGAGAVAGDSAGLVLVYHPYAQTPPCCPSGYQLMKMELDPYGTRIRS